MRIAKHPYDDSDIEAIDFLKVFGNKTTSNNDKFLLPKARCKVCKGQLTFAAGATNRVPHFRHSKDALCPTKSNAGQPYVNLTPTSPNPQLGIALRREFRQLWKWHYLAIKDLVPFLSIFEFLDLINIATQKRSWEYIGLTQHKLPYCLVLMADFSPWTGYKPKNSQGRNYWFRFWYEHKITELNDIWIKEKAPILHRASFLPPTSKRGRPKYEDIVADRIVNIRDNFLDVEEPSTPEYITKTVDDWFSKRKDFS